MMARQTPEAEGAGRGGQSGPGAVRAEVLVEEGRQHPAGARRPDLDHDPDVATELRAIVGCVITDSLDPAIADLETVAHYRPERPARKRLPRPATAGKESEEAVESPAAASRG